VAILHPGNAHYTDFFPVAELANRKGERL